MAKARALIQTDLFGNKLELNVEWVFIGIFPATKLGIDRDEWRKLLSIERYWLKY